VGVAPVLNKPLSLKHTYTHIQIEHTPAETHFQPNLGFDQ